MILVRSQQNNLCTRMIAKHIACQSGEMRLGPTLCATEFRSRRKYNQRLCLLQHAIRKHLLLLRHTRMQTGTR
jgi:hypothetical protein